MKAAAYARYSTDNQTNNSIAYQLEKIQSYCNENNIQITHFFVDEAQSGTNTDRIGFNNMLNAAKNKEFEAIVIYDITRGSRDVGDWFNFRKIMAALNIQVISCTQKLGDIYNGNDFLVELISVGLGQREVLETRQKSIDGVAVKAKQGKFLGGVAPLGYKIVDGNYVIEPTEAQIVKKIFTMYANGYSYAEIANNLGDFTGRYGRKFGKTSLYSIVKNERYIGTYFWNKHKVKLFRKWAGGELNPDVIKIENSIPAIISKEIWEACQMRLSNNKRNAQNKAKREYLLSGLIECSSCGASYVGHTSRRKSTNGNIYESVYYVCGTKTRTKGCKSKNLKAEEIETFVVAHLKNFLKTADFKEVSNYIAEQINSHSQNVDEEKKELLKIDTKIKNGVNALLNGADIPELSKEIELLRIRKSELTDIINAAQSENKQVDPEKIEKILNSALNEIDNSENLKRLINTFVTKIYANPDGSATVHMGIRLSDEIMGYTQKNKPEIIGLKNSSGGPQPPLCENNITEKTPNVNNEFFIIQTFIFKAA